VWFSQAPRLQRLGGQRYFFNNETREISGLARSGVFSLEGENPYDIKAAHMGDHQGNLPPDGHLDLVITASVEGAADNVTVLFNDQDGQGQFGNRQDIPLQTGDPRGLVVEDLDLDGWQDVAVATWYVVGTWAYASVELLWREPDANWYHRVIGKEEGMPAFATGKDIVAGRVVRSPGSPPLLDLVMSTGSLDLLITLLNEGGRDFADPIVLNLTGLTSHPLGIALGRFHTGVARLDLVASDSVAEPPTGDSADVFFWDESLPNWEFMKDYEVKAGEQVGRGPWGVAVGKINADTKNDFVVAMGQDAPCSPGGGIAVFVGYGDGTFREPPYLFCVDPGNNPKPRFVKIADMDQDGFNDVVTSNNGTDNISVLINALEAIPPGGG